MALSFFNTRVAVVAGLALCTLANPMAAAAHHVHVDSVSFDTDGGKEKLVLHWSQPVAFEVQEFSSAGQLLVRLEGAHLVDGFQNTQLQSTSGFAQGIRVNEFTTASGEPGVQLRFTLSPWGGYSVVETPEGLVIEPQKSSSAPSTASVTVTSGSQPEVITLSNEDIEKYGFGSSKAPVTGAGQVPAEALPFYVPPDLSSQERTKGLLETDLGMIATQELFNRNVNLDFKDAQLENVIRTIANKLRLNLILMPGDITGRVTVSLSNVTLGDAFDAMLRANDLAYKIEKGGIVRVVPRKEVQVSEKETLTQSVAINWVDAGELAGILQSFVSEEGSIQAHTQSNTIVINDVPEKVSELQSLIQRLDVPEKQVRMEVRLVDMTQAAFRGLGFSNQIASRNVDTIVEVDGDGILGDTPQLTPQNITSVGGNVDATGGLDINQRSTMNLFGNIYEFESRLTALERRNEAVTLAAPLIVSLNNITSSIEIKRQIPYRDATNTAQGSVATIRFQDIGTRIEITPRITNNGYVVMDILPEQKILVGTDNSTGTPIIDERLAETSVIAKDEETVMIGGLRQFEASNSETGVPWFMKIPVLDFFFQTTTNSQNKTELVVFVTPTIVKDPEPTPYERAIYDKIDYNWELPDYFFDSVEIQSAPDEANNPYIKRSEF